MRQGGKTWEGSIEVMMLKQPILPYDKGGLSKARGRAAFILGITCKVF